jgi:hypothetical protein
MTESDEILRGYLLGELAPPEETALEERYFSDPQLFDRIVDVENDLVDKYARGLLSGEVRRRFESHYLADPRRRERAEFAATLAAKTKRTTKPLAARRAKSESWLGRFQAMGRPRFAWAFSLVLLLLLGLIFWFAIETEKLHRQLARIDAERAGGEQREHDLQQKIAAEQQHAEELSAELERMRSVQPEVQASPSPASATAFVSLALGIAGIRGAESGAPRILLIPPKTEQVRLLLNLKESDYPAYRAVLQSADGQEVFTWKQLGARSGKSGVQLTLTAPAQRFATGDYILTLKGLPQTGTEEDVSKSRFRVERK